MKYEMRLKTIEEIELLNKCKLLYKIITIEFNNLFYNIRENSYITYPLDDERMGQNNAIA